jgi:Tfp pilus assembly protein PilX
MSKFQMNNKGIALYLVLTILLVVVIFANIVLTLISNQNLLTHHQVKRIQAYYAGQAGVNYALEALRLNDSNWASDTQVITRRFCRGCTSPNVSESDFPASINYVDVTVGLRNLLTGLRTIYTTVNYTGD